MPTQLFAATTSAASSSDLTVTDSDPIAVSIKGKAGLDTLIVERRDSAGSYNTVQVLMDSKPGTILAGAGVYRVRKVASTLSFGADQD